MSIMADDELFDCFGSESDGENDVNGTEDLTFSSPIQENTASSLQAFQTRDPNCGVCSQLNAEKSLLVHVRNNMRFPPKDGHDQNPKDNGKDEDIPTKTAKVQKIIDNFCYQRAWMMHIGPEKGLVIQNALRKRINEFVHELQTREDDGCKVFCPTIGKTNFVCVELGTYCGYGSTVLSQILHQYAMNYEQIDFHLFTVEINPSFAQIAREFIDLCGMTKYVTIIEIDLLISGEIEDVGLLLKKNIREHYDMYDDQDSKLDFVLIDHDKDSYLSDLQLLERHAMIKQGTTVVADNVVFAAIDNYVSYMKALAAAGRVTSETVESMVEYSSAEVVNDVDKEKLYKDGIGKSIELFFHCSF